MRQKEAVEQCNSAAFFVLCDCKYEYRYRRYTYRNLFL